MHPEAGREALLSPPFFWYPFAPMNVRPLIRSTATTLLSCLLLSACGGGRIESAESELNSVRKRVAKLERDEEEQQQAMADLTRELKEVRTVAAQVNADSDALQAAVEGLTERLSETNTRLDKLSSRMGSGAATAGYDPSYDGSVDTGIPVPTEPRPSPDMSSAPPAQMYDMAYGDYTKGNFALALLEFQEYLTKYPDTDLADNAQYWVAESYFQQRKYEDAIREYDKIFSRYPASDKVPGAYLKKGFAFLELNQTAQGVVQLQYLIGKYPSSDEARVAQRRLESMGLKPR